jgi:hypothetical protein
MGFNRLVMIVTTTTHYAFFPGNSSRTVIVVYRKNVPASEFIRFGDLFELGVEGVAFPRDEAT